MGMPVFPFCCLAWGLTIVGVMAVMATSFKRTFSCTFLFSAPDPASGHCWPTPLLETLGHSQASLAQSPVGSLLLSPGSWYAQGFICARQEFVSPVLWKFCNQIPLASKVKFPGSSQSSCPILRLGNLLWALELLQQCERPILQLVGHLLGSVMVALTVISSKRTYATHRLPGLLQPEPLSPWQATDDLCLTGDTQAPKVRSGLVSDGGHCIFP